MKKAPIVIVVLVLLAGGILLANAGKDKKPSPTTNASSSNSNSSTKEQAVPTNAVSIANMSFTPRAITVPLGATVHWNNNNEMVHTIVDDGGSFVSGEITNGKSYTHMFDKPGTYRYHCGIHSSMTGTVIVREQ